MHESSIGSWGCEIIICGWALHNDRCTVRRPCSSTWNSPLRSTKRGRCVSSSPILEGDKSHFQEAATALVRASTTLGRFIGVRDHFHLNFICRWLCVFTRSETAVTKILLNCIMLLEMKMILQIKCLELEGATLWG